MSKDIQIILEKKNLELLEKIKFENEKDKLNFLTKIEQIEKSKVKLKFLNNDIKEIILQIELNKKNIDKLQKFNWEDFLEITREFHNKKSNQRQKKIYNNFLTFIKNELGITKAEKPLIDKNLIRRKTKEEEEEKDTFNASIYEKKANFDIEKDTLEKAKKYNVEILFDYKQQGKKNTVNDFVLYFTKRLKYFTDLLQNRIDADNVMRISKLKDLYETNEVVTIIGLINEIKYTKNGHLMLTIEDRGGEIKCFINKNKIEKKGDKYDPGFASKIGNLCLDEGIGIIGKVGKEIIWTDDILIPSPPNQRELKKTQETNYVVCISDLHFGAKVFVDEAFQKFIDWLNGRTSSTQLNDIAKQVKYVLIPGDLIEGIGIYPGQGEDARILSTELQYHETARWLDQIPKDKCIIMIPGNHDTMRLSEPQLKLPYDKAYALHNMENVINLSNPSIIKLFPDDPECFGLDFYMYHGGSIFYYADKIQYLREKGGAKAPEEVIKYLLEKRHLAPSHGSTLYIPDSQSDPLVIKKMPDFFITGHTHKMSLANYKGCTICSCGCWVEMSDYQEKMGMYPDVGKAILINTRTRKPQIINFHKEK